ncbi:hypothetical protein [Parasitella parasitica]|uniref:Uncharacterized protein n=1 Tax=Parasitella parasitica TaxID=35722 RepID=A0A0B7NUY2_9FUNG|nr:hypothetical protein [Parasitella parasitica]
MSEKQFIQKNVPQENVYRNLKAIGGVAKVNLKTFNSVKEAVLTAIYSNKPNKMKFLSSDDLEKIKTFNIPATQKVIQDKTFKPMKFTD